MKKYLTCLSIAGSDPSCGAGIQADLKTFSALGVYGLTVLTALTVQDTRGVRGVFPVSADCVEAQLESIFEDINPAFVKIGMLADAAIIRTVVKVLKTYRPQFVLLDPILVSSSGYPLLSSDAVVLLKAQLIPFCSLVTPNLPEACVLMGIDGADSIQMDEDNLMKMGRVMRGSMQQTDLLIKGGHREGDAADILFEERETRIYSSERIKTKNTHGTGCTLSAAITAYRAMGYRVPESVERAKDYLRRAMESGKDIVLGHGNGPLNHFFAPECQIIK